MSTLTVAQVLQRVEKALTGAEFVRSVYVYDLFGQDTDHLLPQAFAVGAPSTLTEDFDGRENYGDEGEAQTNVLVRVAHRLRGDAQVEDYHEALLHEHRALKAVASNVERTGGLKLQIQGIPQRLVNDTGEWMISTLQFRVFHRFAFLDGV